LERGENSKGGGDKDLRKVQDFVGDISAMGRNIPMVEITSSHSTLSLALFVVWMGALVAIVSSLCGIWSKKPTESSSTKGDSQANADATVDTTGSPSSSPTRQQATNSDDVDDDTSKPLPPPPSATKLELGEWSGDKRRKPKIDKSLSSLQPYISKNTSKKRKLSSSISMSVPSKIKDKASEFKDKAVEIRDDIGHHTGLKQPEDSLWTKRIMLGEKCRLRAGDDEDVFLDEEIKNRILTKSRSHISGSTPSSSHSFPDQGTVTSQEETSKDKLKGKEIQSDADS